jgi:hypothetical protein
MIQRAGQIYRRGKLINGWRIGDFHGVNFKGQRVYQAVREVAGPRCTAYPAGTEALVSVRGKAQVIDKTRVVPEELEGTWRSWKAMTTRTGYHGKSARKATYDFVVVCAEWAPKDLSWFEVKRAFFAFAEDVGIRPDGKSIDRIDPWGDYVPNNVRWSDARTQARNQRYYA